MGLVVVVGVSWCWFCSLSHHVLMLASVYFCLDVTDDADSLFSVCTSHGCWTRFQGEASCQTLQQVLQEHRRSPLGSVTEETSADLNQPFTGSS